MVPLQDLLARFQGRLKGVLERPSNLTYNPARPFLPLSLKRIFVKSNMCQVLSLSLAHSFFSPTLFNYLKTLFSLFHANSITNFSLLFSLPHLYILLSHIYYFTTERCLFDSKVHYYLISYSNNIIFVSRIGNISKYNFN